MVVQDCCGERAGATRASIEEMTEIGCGNGDGAVEVGCDFDYGGWVYWRRVGRGKGEGHADATDEDGDEVPGTITE